MLLHLDEILTLVLNGSTSLYMDGLAWTITQTATWIPVAVVLMYVIIRNNDLPGVLLTVLAFALCILLADQMASTVFKPLVARFRPTNDPFIMYSIDVVNGYRGGRYGFFSSHAANTMAVATFVSLLIRHRPLVFWLFSWALLNCWSRVYLGVHYIGDLTVGTLWGVFVGWAVWRVWRHYQKRYTTRYLLFAMRPGFTFSGYSISTVRLLVATLALTYLLITFRALFFFS